MHMHDNDIIDTKGGVKVVVVFPIVTVTESGHDESPRLVQEFIHRHAKNSCFRQASSTVALPKSSYNYHSNGFPMPIAPIDEAG